MGYVFLFLSVLAGSVKGFCGKKISTAAESPGEVFFVNVQRMLLCIIIGGIAVATKNPADFLISFRTLFITFLSGTATAMFAVLWIFSIKNGAYVMMDIFLMLGAGVTVLLCFIFFGETPTSSQYAGYFMLIIATVIMCTYNVSIKGSLTLKSLLLPTFCCIFSSIADFSQKLYVTVETEINPAVFNFYTYVFSAFVILLFYSGVRIKSGEQAARKPHGIFRFRKWQHFLDKKINI